MKRFLAVLLCMVLCVSMLPSAYAADIEIVEIETPEDAELISIIDPAAEIGQEKAAEPAVDMDAVKYSGTCGDNALWSIDDEGVMTITGTGAMYDYGKGDSPWYSYRETVKKAVVGNGITVIGSNTFRYCSNLKSVSLPSSITSINAKAFIGCTGLSSITLPKNIKEIGESMFEGCTGLKNIEVPSAVTTLGKYAFYNSGLTQITLPASLKSIGSQAFTSCASLSKVYYLGTGAAWSNISISSGNDPLLNAELIIYSKPAITTHPATVTKAAGETAKFTVKATGTNLSYQWQYRTGAGQSWSNSWLTGYNSATLTVKAESYREGYQYRCKISNSLGTVYTNNAALHVKAKPAVTTQPQSITTSADTTVKFSVKATGSDLSYQWQYRTSSTGSWNTSTMTGCKTATMTVKATAARDGYQYRCKVSNSLGTVYTNAATLTVKQVKPVISSHPKTVTVELDTTVKFTVQATGAESYQWQYRTGAGATWYNSTMSGCKTATMTVKATAARDGYQYRCKVTNSVGSTYSNNAALHVLPVITTQPLSCTASVGATVSFTIRADGVKSYQWQYRTSSTDSWKNSTATGCKTETLTVKAESYRNGYQYRCKAMNTSSEVFSEAATLSTSAAQCGDNLHWVLDSNGLLTISGTGAMYDYYETRSSTDDNDNDHVQTVFYTLPWGNTPKQVILRDGVTSIGGAAFYYCKDLSGVVFSDSVTTIGTMAFCGCTSLTEFTIPDSVTDVGGGVFGYCSSLETVTLGKGITALPGVLTYNDDVYDEDYIGFFKGCKKLSNVVIPNNITTIGAMAFCDCTSLTEFTIPDSVTDVGGGVFYGCSALETVTIGKGVKALETVDTTECSQEFYWGFFEECQKLSTVSIPENVEAIGAEAFCNCTSLTSITIPDSVTDIGGGVFFGCSSLKAAVIGKGITALPALAVFNEYSNKTDYSGFFEGCGKLSNVTIGNGVTSIGDETFRSCSSLTSVTIPDSVTSIGDRAFSNCSSLTSVTIPVSVTSIGWYAFYGCTSLTSVTIPDSVTSIGWYAFYGCTSLTSVTIPDSVTSIGYNTFSNCSALTSVTIPDSVTSIDDRAFFGCTSLTSVTIGNGVASIGWDAFCGCTSLTSVTIPDSVTEIGYDTFNGCRKLKDVYFKGAEEQWAEITIDDGNEPLLTATIHYNA